MTLHRQYHDNDASFFSKSLQTLDAKVDGLAATHRDTNWVATEKIDSLKTDIDVIASIVSKLESVNNHLQEKANAAKAVIDQLTISQSEKDKKAKKAHDLITDNHKTLVKQLDSQITCEIRTLHRHVDSVSGHVSCVRKLADSIQENLAQDKKSHCKITRDIRERVDGNFKILNDKIDSDIMKLCFHNSLEPALEDEFDTCEKVHMQQQLSDEERQELKDLFDEFANQSAEDDSDADSDSDSDEVDRKGNLNDEDDR